MTVPAGKQIGDSGHVAHHNDLASLKLDVATASATYATAVVCKGVGIDPTGATDSTTAFLAKLAEANAAERDLVIPEGRYVLTSGLSWDATKHSVRGLGRVLLDFRTLATGPALTITGRAGKNGTTDLGYTASQIMHEWAGTRLIGPDADATTVDGVVLRDITNGAQVNVDRLHTYGFRDAVTFEDNVWCPRFTRFFLGHAKRRLINFQSAVNGGENMGFHGGTLANCRNTAGTASAVHTSEDCQFLSVVFNGVSFDYSNTEIDHNAGVLTLVGCHMENDSSGAMVKLGYTAGKHRTVLFVNGGVLDPSEARPGRSHLVEVKSTSGSAVHANLATMVRGFNRSFDVVRNLSAATPFVRVAGSVLDNSFTTDAPAFGPLASLMTNGDCEGALIFLPNALDEGGWWRQGTVTYSFSTEDARAGTQSIKAVGTGAVASTSVGQTMRVTEGQQLTYRMYNKITGYVSGQVQVRLTFLRADKSTLQTNILATYTANQSWQAFAGSRRVPGGAYYASLTTTHVDLNGTSWVDDAELVAL